MRTEALFGISILFSFVAWGILTKVYLWPTLRSRPRALALKAPTPLAQFSVHRFGFSDTWCCFAGLVCRLCRNLLLMEIW